MQEPLHATTRKARYLRVLVLPDEEAQINWLAARPRRVGLGHRLPGMLDHRRVQQLAHINGDMGRLKFVPSRNRSMQCGLTLPYRLRQICIYSIE